MPYIRNGDVRTLSFSRFTVFEQLRKIQSLCPSIMNWYTFGFLFKDELWVLVGV